MLSRLEADLSGVEMHLGYQIVVVGLWIYARKAGILLTSLLVFATSSSRLHSHRGRPPLLLLVVKLQVETPQAAVVVLPLERRLALPPSSVLCRPLRPQLVLRRVGRERQIIEVIADNSLQSNDQDFVGNRFLGSEMGILAEV